MQILNRYKILFSNDHNYREPDKVILKNSDDLILFGDDLIKDVLSDMSQVKVLTETFKSKPKFYELYEEFCTNQKLKNYPLIAEILKKSDETAFLFLNNLIFENNLSFHFEIIFHAIIENSKQTSIDANIFIKKLVHLDLSCNYLTDKIMNLFFEKIFFYLDNLKYLNLSNNNISIKTLKLISELSSAKNQALEKKLNVFNFLLKYLNF